MNEPPRQEWWEQMGPWGMTGAGAGIGLFLAVVVVGTTSLSRSINQPAVATAPDAPKALAPQREAVTVAGPTAFAPAAPPVEIPTGAPAARPPEQGTALATRQAIYRELHRVGMQALRDADRQFPLDAIPADQGDLAEKYLLGHQAATRLSRRAGRLALSQKYGLAAADLDAVQREGNQEHWPAGDD